MIDRRSFLASSAAAALAALAPERLLAAAAAATPPLPDLSTWAAVRSQFNLSPGWIHLSNFFFVSHPRPVRDAIEAYRRVIDSEPYLEVDRRMFGDPANNIQLTMRADMSGYLGSAPEEIAITGSTTEGLALVYAGMPLEPGDEVLTTMHDHYSQHESIRFAVEKSGARMRRVALYASAAEVTVAEVTANLRKAIRRETRAVGLTWVHSCTGVRLPIRALADVVAEANRGRAERDRILLVVDGLHGLGAVDETIAGMGCDFFCAGTHKWMFAPRGTGIVWAKADRWARLKPTIPTFASLEAWNAWMEDQPKTRVTTAFDITPGGFHAYEHQWAMTAAFRFHEKIGRRRVAERIRELNDRCKAALAASRRVKVITPRDPALSAGIVCFEVEGMKPEDVGQKMLERKIVAGPSPYLPSYVRFSPGLANTPEEVDAAVRAVREIATV